MLTFDLGETVICSITVKDEDGTLQDAATSMNIVIERVSPYLVVVTSTAMTDDTGTGYYHYDFDTSTMITGVYRVIYTATDGARITIQTDTFKLE